MKKIFFVITICVIGFSCSKENTDPLPILLNNELSVDDAKFLVMDFISDSIIAKSVDMNFVSYNLRNYEVMNKVKKESGKEIIKIYEFITETNGKKGYSVVIGDKRIQKVIASVVYGSLEDTLKIMPLKEYFRAIPSIIEEELYAFYTKNTSKTTKDESGAHYCFLSTSWGQDIPYNNQCPIRCDWRAPTGCSVTAVAQILAYHNIPSSLNWSAILANRKVTNNSLQTVINDVSWLMVQLGDEMETEYGCFSSPTYTRNVPKGFSRFGVVANSPMSYSWFNVTESLNRNRPVYMRGDLNGGEGHAWVCDGWKIHPGDYRYLSFNWGADGASDGFFYVTDPINFNGYTDNLLIVITIGI